MGRVGAIPRPSPAVSCLPPTSVADYQVIHQPIRLLVFSHNLDFEGASLSLKELVCELKERLVALPVVVAFGDGPLREHYESRQIDVHVLPSIQHKTSTLQRLLREVERLSDRIRSYAPDVVLVNTLLNFPAILAAERAAVPSVWNPRESESWDSYFRYLPDPVAQQAIGAIGLPRKVVFVAEATRDVWKDFDDGKRFTVIHNSLDLSRFAEQLGADKDKERQALGWGSEEVTFLCVGTLCKRKGQADALLALKEIAEELTSPIRLVFVGEAAGRYARRQLHRAESYRGHKWVRIDFVDSTAAVGRYYLAADVFLLCSRVESFPRVVLEAMAFGLPIITTPVFGIAEQLPDPKDACFFEPGDAKSLGRRILQLTNDPALRRQLGQRSKSRFSQMPSFGQMVNAYAKVLRGCANVPTEQLAASWCQAAIRSSESNPLAPQDSGEIATIRAVPPAVMPPPSA